MCFSLILSLYMFLGLLNPACVGLIGSGVVVHLPSLFIELDALVAQGLFLFTLILVTLSN